MSDAANKRARELLREATSEQVPRLLAGQPTSYCSHSPHGDSDRCSVMACPNYYMKDNVRQETTEHQIKRLAMYIVENVPGEPSKSESAVDCAIRILNKHYGTK